LGRYQSIPPEYLQAIEESGLVVNATKTAWLLTTRIFAGTAGIAYAWNEWEQQSLDAASGDDVLTSQICRFWDQKFPILFSVKSGYAYFALDLASGRIFQGEEPDYEDPSDTGMSLPEFLERLAKPDVHIQRWV
jgi:hypothetical protein